MKGNDVYSWIVLYPADEEYKKILLYFLSEKKEGLTLQNIDGMIERRKKKAVAVYNERYKNYDQQADSLGINWKEAKFEKYNCMAIYSDELRLKYLTGHISFSNKSKKYFIDGVDAVEIEAGYRLQTVSGIRQRRVRNTHSMQKILFPIC